MRTEVGTGRARRARAGALWCAFAAAMAVGGALAPSGTDELNGPDAAGGIGAAAALDAAVEERGGAERAALADGSVVARQRVDAAPFTETRPSTGAVRVLVTRNGAPLGGAAVALRPWFGADPDLATRRAATDARGAASFADLPPGAYAVAMDYGAAKSAEVRVDAEATVELVVAGGFDVEGEVVDDVDGKPVPFAEIYVDGARRMSRVPTTRADAEGRFRLAGLPVGNIDLIAVGAMRSCGEASVFGGERDLVRARIECDAEAGDVEIRCVDENGRPMEGATVAFEFGADGDDVWEAHTSALDRAGAARFVGVTAGHVYVRGKASDGRVADGDAEVAVGATARIELGFRRAVRLNGLVVGDDGETPIPETEVELVNDDQFGMSDLTRKTDKDGRFSFPPFLTRGGVNLYARHPRLGYAVEELAADACVGDVVVRLKLDSRRILCIRLLDAEDAAVGVAPIYVRTIRDDGGDGDAVRWVTTGTDGRAIAYDLPPDVRYRVGVAPFASRRGWCSAKCETETAAGAPEALLRLGRCEPATCVVRGRLLGPGDRPLGSAAVKFGHRTDPHGFASTAVTDADGRFEAGGIAPGEVTPRLDDSRTGLTLFESRTLTAGEAWDLGDRRVGEPGRIVFVRSDSGVAPRCTLHLDYGGAPGGGEWLTFDANGRAERWLAAGTYVPTFGCVFETDRGSRALALALGDAEQAERLGMRGAERLTPLHVAAGEVREVVLPTMATRSRTLSAAVVPDEDGSAPWVTAYVALFGRGPWLLAASAQASCDDGRRFTTVLGLPRGKHLIFVASGGRSATTEVVVSDDDGAAEIAFDLRR